jgi:hypothetical protein
MYVALALKNEIIKFALTSSVSLRTVMLYRMPSHKNDGIDG